ncbi:hypothetical protein PBAL39_15559 [Pedobacter sp. BAL39]|nr:hypothetical protein PBAL39_15559 [Pedobacter sp. BAL39]
MFRVFENLAFVSPWAKIDDVEVKINIMIKGSFFISKLI